MPTRELRPVKESSQYREHIQKLIIEAFRSRVFAPLIKRLKVKPRRVFQNAADDGMKALYEALAAGRVRYERGKFTGKFGAEVSKALRSAGAKWDAKLRGYRLPASKVSPAMVQAIALSETAFAETLAAVDERLAKVLPEKIADDVKISGTLDRLLWQTDQNLVSTLERLTVAPQLTPERRRRIADEWQNNMRLEIKKFADEEIVSLRKRIQRNVYAGNRYESVVKEIAKSYGVTASKAKFLARQETNLLLSKFKETRYAESGVHEYRWRCVVGSPKHPVRPAHAALNGKVFRFDDPPVTTEPGEPQRRNNPGEDFNCRCLALPIVRF